MSAGGEEEEEGELEEEDRGRQAAGGEQGAADCRQPQGIQLLGNSPLEQLLRHRGSTLIPF